MYEQQGFGLSLPQNNLQFIQNQPVKMMNGRQLRRLTSKRNKSKKTSISQVTKGF